MRRGRLGRFWFNRGSWRWRIGQNTFDDGRLLVGRFLRTAGDGRWIFHFLCHFVTGFDMVQTGVVVLEAL
jgi:hypothetical protein